MLECGKEYEQFYVPELEKAKRDKAAREEARQRAELDKLRADMAGTSIREQGGGSGAGGAAAGAAGASTGRRQQEEEDSDEEDEDMD